MPWFRHSPPPAGQGQPDPDQQRRDWEALEAGELPAGALRRLRAQSDRGGLFTSDLSVGEFAATLRDGWRPKGLVMGSSVFRVSWPAASLPVYGGGMGMGGMGMGGMGMGGMGGMGGGYGGYAVPASCEVETLTRAAQQCRQAALDRLSLEAEALGAHGVVGVRLQRSVWDWGQGLAEFMAVGTAIELPGAKALSEPFAGAVSGTEAAKLLAAGYAPRAVVAGSCIYYVSGMEAAWAGLNYANQPLKDTSRAVAAARELAVRRLRSEAASLGADGIVGMRLDFHAEAMEMQEPDRTDHLLDVCALGTAVVALRSGRGSGVPVVRPVVDASD